MTKGHGINLATGLNNLNGQVALRLNWAEAAFRAAGCGRVSLDLVNSHRAVPAL